MTNVKQILQKWWDQKYWIKSVDHKIAKLFKMKIQVAGQENKLG